MTEEEALKIAKIAYMKIQALIEELEIEYPSFCAHWDGCISIGEHFFTDGYLNG